MVVIHHNPECGTSRNVLKIIQDAGYKPVVIEYIRLDDSPQSKIKSSLFILKINFT